MDSILYWNNVALEANRDDFTVVPATGKPRLEQGGPTLSSRALAIVHLAMYDAFAGITKTPNTLKPYLTGLPVPPPGAGLDAAVAAAAFDTLSHLYPAQLPAFNAALQAAVIPAAGKLTGTAFGKQVAAAIIADRAADPPASDVGYMAPVHAAAHQPDPEAGSSPPQGFHAPFYGGMAKCFAVHERYGLNPPPLPGDADYISALKEVRGKGIAPELMGTVPNGYPKRTATETMIGLYWGYDGANKLGTPPRLYNLIVREVAKARGNSAAQNARLFALVNTAMADAAILAWDQKYFHNVWRPVVGMRQHDASTGPLATPGNLVNGDCDPGWIPMGAPNSNKSGAKNGTPPFPAYPSGHATFGAAAFQITRRFYGIDKDDTGPDNLFDGMSFISEELNGITTDSNSNVRPRHVRNFPGGLWQMIEENGRSRVYLGVHWVFDAFAVDGNNQIDITRNIGGVPLGLKIANDIFGASREAGLEKSEVGPRL